jgi:hypothetical protein
VATTGELKSREAEARYKANGDLVAEIGLPLFDTPATPPRNTVRKERIGAIMKGRKGV